MEGTESHPVNVLVEGVEVIDVEFDRVSLAFALSLQHFRVRHPSVAVTAATAFVMVVIVVPIA